MTTGQDLLTAAARFLGEPYSTAPGRTSPTSGFKDCSGLVAAAYEVSTGSELGAYVTVTIWQQAVANGLTITREEADGIPGSCYLMPEDPSQGWGPNGHIGFSTGDGFTIEATPAGRGGVQRLPNRFQPWGSHAVLLPGINYFGTTEEEDSMQIAVGQTVFGVSIAGVVDGGLIGETFTGPVGEYGIPQTALDWNSQPGRGLKYVFLDPQRLAAALTPRNEPGDCPDCPPGVDQASAKELVAALAKKV